MTTESPRSDGTSRRALLAGAGAVGAGVLLAACGDDGGGPGPGGQPPPPGNGGQPAPPAPPPPDDDDDLPEGALAAVSEVEVGGGLVNSRANVVVTQPAQGEFRAFSATCTHEGCQVASVRNGTINCPCHGSQYSIEDGSVVQAAFGGPPGSQRPLAQVEIEVEGDTIMRGD
jgi:Rieske Fe-S protein